MRGARRLCLLSGVVVLLSACVAPVETGVAEPVDDRARGAAHVASPVDPPVAAPADAIGDLIADLPLARGVAGEPDAPVVASETAPAELPGAAVAAVRAGEFSAYLRELRSASCASRASPVTPEALPLTVRRVPLQTINPGRRTVGALTFLGGFDLVSTDDRLGGLSGLAVLESGDLLAVSDRGAFVWIDLDADRIAPVAVRHAGLKDHAGQSLANRPEGDAEGLALLDGLALVSFERFHRVLAYDVGGCGAAARGVAVPDGPRVDLAGPVAASGLRVGANSGPEALAVTPDGYLLVGLETKAGDAGPVSVRPLEATAEFALRVGAGAPDLVGMDVLTAGPDGRDLRVFSLHRSTSALAGNAITLVESVFTRVLDPSNLPARGLGEIDERSRYRFREDSSRRLAELNVLFTIDNFEGLAVRQMPDGRVRLYVISDNNFSARQRTLFFVFELPA